jgi:hypothetical protein
MLERSNRARIAKLEEALDNVRQLQGIIPICAWCKRIRDDNEFWHRVEDYLGSRSKAQFTHAICEECREKEFTEAVDEKASASS